MIRIQQEDFDIGAELAQLTSDDNDIGAVVTFTGQVRGTAEGDSLTAMTIEHYPGMTEREIETIEREANARFDLKKSLIVHRYGTLKPGDNIVLVITASEHREPAFRAAEFLMDYLKSHAPFWKSESGPDGERWVEVEESDAEALSRWDDDKDAAE